MDFKTCSRSEFIAEYKKLEKENRQLKKNLEEYEGSELSENEKEAEFQRFWIAYGKKGNVKTSRRRWLSLSKKKKELAMDKVAAYVKSTPDKRYRKAGETWLNQECWNDEIESVDDPKMVRSAAYLVASNEDKQQEERKIAENTERRRSNRGVDVRQRLFNKGATA